MAQSPRKAGEPTQGPWTIESGANTFAVMASGKVVAMCAGSHLGPRFVSADEAKANAALIVRAVNSHAALVTSAQAAWHLCQSLLATRRGATDDLVREIADALEKALAAAKP